MATLLEVFDVLRDWSFGRSVGLVAGHNEIGSLGATMCRHGRTFCDNPFYVLVAAVLAAVWGAFVSVR